MSLGFFQIFQFSERQFIGGFSESLITEMTLVFRSDVYLSRYTKKMSTLKKNFLLKIKKFNFSCFLSAFLLSAIKFYVGKVVLMFYSLICRLCTTSENTLLLLPIDIPPSPHALFYSPNVEFAN